MADMMDITKLTVEQLKSELLKYNLETKGRKSELLARLVDHLEASDEEKEEEEEKNEQGEEEEAEANGVDEDGDEAVDNAEEKKAEDDEAELECLLSDEKEEVAENEEQTSDNEKKEETKEKEVEEKVPEEDKTISVKITDSLMAQITSSNLVREASRDRQSKVLIISPICLSQLSSTPLSDIIAKCCVYHFRSTPFSRSKADGCGHLELTFVSDDEMKEADTQLKEMSEDIKISSLSSGRGKNARAKIVFDVTGDPTFAMGQGKRVVCIIGAPESMTEEQILELFPGFIAIIGKTDSGKSGRAFVEFLTEEDATAAVDDNQGLVIEEHKVESFLVGNAPPTDRPRGNAYEKGVPMVVPQMRNHMKQAINLRTLLVRQWSQNPISLRKILMDIAKAETNLVEDEEYKKKCFLPGASYWRVLLGDSMKQALRSVPLQYQHIGKLSTEELTDRLDKRDVKQAEAKKTKEEDGGKGKSDSEPEKKTPRRDIRSRGARGGRGTRGRMGGSGRDQPMAQKRGSNFNRERGGDFKRPRYNSYNSGNARSGGSMGRGGTGRGGYQSAPGRGGGMGNNPVVAASHMMGMDQGQTNNALNLLVGLSQVLSKQSGGRSDAGHTPSLMPSSGPTAGYGSSSGGGYDSYRATGSSSYGSSSYSSGAGASNYASGSTGGYSDSARSYGGSNRGSNFSSSYNESSNAGGYPYKSNKGTGSSYGGGSYGGSQGYNRY